MRRISKISRRLFTEAVTIHRATAGAFNEYGEHTEGTYINIDTKAITEPISAADSEHIEILPEGVRVMDARRFWLDGQLDYSCVEWPVTADVRRSWMDDGVTLNDWIEYDGDKFKIFSLEKHRDHIEIIASIQNITPDPAP